MIQRCKDCQQEYDITKQSSLCPHKEHFKCCKKHNRVLCGMPECNKQGGEDDNNYRIPDNCNSISNRELGTRS